MSMRLNQGQVWSVGSLPATISKSQISKNWPDFGRMEACVSADFRKMDKEQYRLVIKSLVFRR